jgi:delta14-sterol reductase
MAAAHVVDNGHIMSRAVATSSLLWTMFCIDYLSNEHIHLYTFDIFAERIGIKLAWGCLCVYPFLYPFGQSVLVQKIIIAEEEDIGWPTTIGVALLYMLGSTLTRGANYQKYVFKTNPSQKSVLGGLIQQQVMTVTIREDKNGTTQERHLLVSGFWGLARHVNYLGEMLQGLALGLPGLLVTQSPLALVYFSFITAILVPRQADDDKLCRAKYGDKAWDAYTIL